MKQLIFILLAIIILSSCQKGEPIESSKYTKVSIPFLLGGDDLELYIDGKLSERTTSLYGFQVTIPQKDKIRVSIKKSGEMEFLQDTTFILTGKVNILPTFAYSIEYGFNQFILGNSFERPSQDSIAFIFFNKYKESGSGKIDITIYKENDLDNQYDLKDSITTIRNLPYEALSEKIVLPAGYKYIVVSRDSGSGIDPWIKVAELYGLPERYTQTYITGLFTGGDDGKIGVVNVFNDMIDTDVYATGVRGAFQL